MTTDPGHPTITAGARVGLVLAAGGVAGYGFHVGALAALERVTGWDPRTATVIAGTSSGSVVATTLATGVDSIEQRERVLATGEQAEVDRPLLELVGRGSFRLPRVWAGPAAPRLVATELRRGRRLDVVNLVTGALPRGRVATRPLADIIARFHQPDAPWPQGPDRQLWIPATDLRTGDRVVFGRDRLDVPLADAVRASCAIPGFFAPAEIDGRAYVDGGISSLDNTDLLADAGLDVVIVSSPMPISPTTLARFPAMRLLQRPPRNRLLANLDRVAATGTEVLVLEPDADVVRTMGFNALRASRLRPIVDAADRSVSAQLRSPAPDPRFACP